MKRVNVLVIVILTVMAALVGCGEKEKAITNAVAPSVVWKEYANSDYGFTLKYPEGWDVRDPNEFNVPGMITVIMDKATGTDTFTTNLNIVTEQSAIMAPSAKTYADTTVRLYSEKGAQLGMEEYKRISFEPVDIGKQKAGVLTGTYVLGQTGQKMQNAQLIVPNGQSTLILTLTTVQADYERNKPVFNEIIKSFDLR